jgi:hypothetical protein
MMQTFSVRRVVSAVDRTWENVYSIFSSSLDLILLLIERATHDSLYLWDITDQYIRDAVDDDKAENDESARLQVQSQSFASLPLRLRGNVRIRIRVVCTCMHRLNRVCVVILKCFSFVYLSFLGRHGSKFSPETYDFIPHLLCQSNFVFFSYRSTLKWERLTDSTDLLLSSYFCWWTT